MSNIDIKALRAAAEMATPGPWEWRRLGLYSKHDDCRRESMVMSGHDIPLAGMRGADAALIAAMRNALPAMLDRLERAEKVEALARELCTKALLLVTTPDDHVVSRRMRAQAVTDLCFSLRAALDDERPKPTALPKSCGHCQHGTITDAQYRGVAMFRCGIDKHAGGPRVWYADQRAPHCPLAAALDAEASR